MRVKFLPVIFAITMIGCSSSSNTNKPKTISYTIDFEQFDLGNSKIYQSSETYFESTLLTYIQQATENTVTSFYATANMKESRALADVVIAGSLFQTAIGGKRIKKQVPVKFKIYDENGKVDREDYKVIEIEEELPPNPLLLKFLAEHKMSEKLGDNPTNNESNYKKMVESLTPEERAMIEAMKKASDINGGK